MPLYIRLGGLGEHHELPRAKMNFAIIFVAVIVFGHHCVVSNKQDTVCC